MQLFTRLVIVSKVKQGSVEKKCGSKLNLGSRFPLNQLSYILFAILLYLLSVRQKVAKNSAQNKISHNSLLKLTIPPFRIPCGANIVCTTHD